MKKKYEVTVNVEYKFTFESELEGQMLDSEAEEEWIKLSNVGLEGDKYHDTEISVREVQDGD